jgi:hypothetical protein
MVALFAAICPGQLRSAGRVTRTSRACASLRRSLPDRFIARRWASFVGPLRVESWRASELHAEPPPGGGEPDDLGRDRVSLFVAPLVSVFRFVQSGSSVDQTPALTSPGISHAVWTARGTRPLRCPAGRGCEKAWRRAGLGRAHDVVVASQRSCLDHHPRPGAASCPGGLVAGAPARAGTHRHVSRLLLARGEGRCGHHLQLLFLGVMMGELDADQMVAASWRRFEPGRGGQGEAAFGARAPPAASRLI